MDNNFLKQAAQAAIDGRQVMAGAAAVLDDICKEVARGEYVWTELPSPRDSRALQALNKAGSKLLVLEFRREDESIGHACTAMRKTASGPLIVNLPQDVAACVYQKAVTARN